MSIFSYTKIGEIMDKSIFSSDEKMEKLTKNIKILGDTSRLKIIMFLFDGEKCVGEISEKVGLSQSATSHQLRILKDSNILKCKKEGNLIYYSIADNHVCVLVKTLIEHLDCK